MRGLGFVEAAAEAEGFRTVVERYCASSEGLCRNGQIGIRERKDDAKILYTWEVIFARSSEAQYVPPDRQAGWSKRYDFVACYIPQPEVDGGGAADRPSSQPYHHEETYPRRRLAGRKLTDC